MRFASPPLTARYGPRFSAKQSGTKRDEALVTSTVTTSPFATIERKTISHGNKACMEYALAISRCFEHVIITSIYPQSEIAIHCTIISADGGVPPCWR